jgi:hypothetical protein
MAKGNAGPGIYSATYSGVSLLSDIPSRFYTRPPRWPRKTSNSHRPAPNRALRSSDVPSSFLQIVDSLSS